jgi:hypothetical protein
LSGRLLFRRARLPRCVSAGRPASSPAGSTADSERCAGQDAGGACGTPRMGRKVAAESAGAPHCVVSTGSTTRSSARAPQSVVSTGSTTRSSSRRPRMSQRARRAPARRGWYACVRPSTSHTRASSANTSNRHMVAPRAAARVRNHPANPLPPRAARPKSMAARTRNTHAAPASRVPRTSVSG